MGELAPLTGELAVWVAQFMTIVARLSFIVFFLPGIGEQLVPVRVRLAVLVAVSAALTANGVVAEPSLSPISNYLELLLIEIAIGFFLGVMLRLVIWMLTIAGSVVAQSIGLSQFLGVALEHEAQTLTANLLSMAGAALLLTVNFHVNVVAGLVRLYADIPVGALSLLNRDFLIASFFDAFGFALLLAWPFVVVNLLYNICLGFINKALPQLMVAFVGAPFMVGAGTALLALSVTALLFAWKDRVLQVIGWL